MANKSSSSKEDETRAYVYIRRMVEMGTKKAKMLFEFGSQYRLWEGSHSWEREHQGEQKRLRRWTSGGARSFNPLLEGERDGDAHGTGKQ